MVYKFLDKKSRDITTHTGIISEDIQLASELHRLMTRKFNKCKIYSSFQGNIWGANIADMQLISRYNKGVRFLLFVIDISGNMHELFWCKTKKVLQSLMHFKFLDQSGHKPNKMWLDQGSKFYNRSLKSCCMELALKCI